MKKRILAGILAAAMLCTAGIYAQGKVAFAEEKERGRWARDGSMMGTRTYTAGSYVQDGNIHEIFPQSYWSYLDALKAAHPNWKFEALQTGVDWNRAIQEELFPTTNLVASGYYPSSWLDLASFNYGTNSWKIDSDPDWVQANRQIIEAYMDPRNFLNEENIFQFERLTFDGDTQTIEGVEAILKGTFMANTVVEGNKTYAQVFMEIGQRENVSPYHLASRIRQEQGVGNSALISGTVPGYEGYYNYFNIEAYGETREEIIRNGMNEAKNNGWTSRYLALSGGAKKVAANYIAKAQDTLYLQKFDVDDQYNSMFWHQYMQNISAAESESQSMRRAYANMGILNSSYTFKIPVFNNMPASPTQKPQGTGNPNERLKSIKVEEKELLDTNDLDRTTYEVNVPCGVETVDVVGTAVASTSMVTPVQRVDVTEGKTQTVIRCIAENGAVRDYTVTINKEEHRFGSWAVSQNGEKEHICDICGKVETQAVPPEITKVQFSDVTSNGYKVTVSIANASSASKVTFPTWTSANGQDDITWDSVKPADTVSYYVETSRHNYEAGKYNTHVYVYDKSGKAVIDGGSVTIPAANSEAKLSYRGHVQNIGWQDWKQSGIIGTTGQSLRVEALNIRLDANISGSIQYRTHVQNIGWQNWAENGSTAGTFAQSLRVEGVQMRLTGELAKQYKIQYRAHVQNIGWTGWVEDGAMAGTVGRSLRMEAMEVRLVKK